MSKNDTHEIITMCKQQENRDVCKDFYPSQHHAGCVWSAGPFCPYRELIKDGTLRKRPEEDK
jgi:hypothetical protein